MCPAIAIVSAIGNLIRFVSMYWIPENLSTMPSKQTSG